jgi:hypothetical protein
MANAEGREEGVEKTEIGTWSRYQRSVNKKISLWNNRKQEKNEAGDAFARNIKS